MPALRHGARSGYRGGCTCDRCRAWNADRMAKYRARKAGKPEPPARRAGTRSTRGATSTTTARPPRRIPGELERNLTDSLATLGDRDNPWTATLRSTALALARSIDEAEASAIPRIVPQLMGVLERLGLDPEKPAASPTRSPVSQPELTGGGEDDVDVPSIGRYQQAGTG